jgi:uncharacterized protein (DUF362 family)
MTFLEEIYHYRVQRRRKIVVQVAIVKGEEPLSMSQQAFTLINAAEVLHSSDRVLIKPNSVVPKPPSSGVTTDARVVEGVIEFVKACGVSQITIAEGGNPGTDRAFEVTGLREVTDRHNVPLINVNADDAVCVEIPTAHALLEVMISRTVFESTCIINVPKLKIHHMTQVTLSIKNLMGAIVGNRGAIMHHQIDEKLVDLARVLRPTLNIIDGLIGAEMDETHGRPVPVGVVIAGTDLVAVDTVGTAVMGVDPTSVRHLQLAVAQGLGIGELAEIEVIGVTISAVAKQFSQALSEDKLRRSYGLTDTTISREQLRALWEQR